MVTITFREIATKRTVYWTENGKKRQKTKKFSQTQNPWNNKSNEEIWREINKEADLWVLKFNNKKAGIKDGGKCEWR